MLQTVLTLGLILAATFFLLARLRDRQHEKKYDRIASQLTSTRAVPVIPDTRDIAQALHESKRKVAIVYGSQTGTAHEYAIVIAKEIKARLGLRSLVFDAEDVDYDSLDQLKDSLVVFVLATYGDGEPTDNAKSLWSFLSQERPEFSNGSSLKDIEYLMFGLGNRTYDQFCAVAVKMDEHLRRHGAKRLGELGLADDNKSVEDDYLAWKEPTFELLSKKYHTTGETVVEPDFEVCEISDLPEWRIFQGELSSRALLQAISKGGDTISSASLNDARNPFAAPVTSARQLFQLAGGRNCTHLELDTTHASGFLYQAGDHVAIWPVVPHDHVDHLLKVLGLTDKRHVAVQIHSLDPALAKVPFPTPTTYDAIFRYYLDILAPASRQFLGALSDFAPTAESKELLKRLGNDQAYYQEIVIGRHLNLAQTLEFVAKDPGAWLQIPFDRIISYVARLQPRFYSISSSPKLYPKSIHVTAVVVKWQPQDSETDRHRFIYGTATNYILNIERAMRAEQKGQSLRVEVQPDNPVPMDIEPIYSIEGPRRKYLNEQNQFCIPIHLRRSRFRLPVSPKVPVIMIGPGTGVAPFRGFVQDRMAQARKMKTKLGEGVMKDWAPIHLFYGCRRADEDYLYKEEWPDYSKELEPAFHMHVAFSRAGPTKVYVQDLIREQQHAIVPLIADGKAQVYICGEKAMSREVEAVLGGLIAAYKKEDPSTAPAEIQALKATNRLSLDVW